MRQTTSIIILEILTGAVLICGLLFGLVTWRLLSGPVSLNAFKSEIIGALENSRGGLPVTLESVSLEWISETRRFEVIASNLNFLDQSENEVATAERAVMDLDAFSLIRGQPKLVSLELEKGHLTISRSEDGQMLIADQIIPPVYPVHFHEASNSFQYFEQSVLNVIDNLSQSSAVQSLEKVQFRSFEIDIFDHKSGLSWTGREINLSVVTTEERIDVNGQGAFEGEGAPETLELDASLLLEGRTFDASLQFSDVDVSRLLTLPSDDISVEGKAKGDLLFQFLADANGVQNVSLLLMSAPGEITVNGSLMEYGQNDLTVFLDVPENNLVFDIRNLNVEKVSLNGQIRFEDASGLAEGLYREPHRVDLALQEMSLDMRPMFAATSEFSSVAVNGVLDFGRRRFDMETVQLDLSNAKVTGRGVIYAPDDPQPEQLPFGVKFTASTEGIISPQDVLAYWPVKLGEGARSWVENNVLEGNIFGADFVLNLTPDSFRDGYIHDEDLKLDFEYSNARVSFLSDLPPITNGYGSARMLGNSFSLGLSGAEFSGWSITSGTVLLPRFNPKGGVMSVFAQGEGQVVEIVETLSRSRLQLEERYGFDPQILSGNGKAEFRFRRPMLTRVPYDDTVLSIEASIMNGGVESVFRDADLTRVFGKLKLDNENLTMTGYGNLENAPVQFVWQDAFRSDDNDRTRLSATGRATSDVLNKIGFPARAYLEGDVETEFKATGRSLGALDEIDVSFDLTENAVDFSDFGWSKPNGVPATATLGFRDQNALSTTRLAINAEDFEFAGDIQTDEAENITGVRLDRLFLQDQMELSGTLSRTDTKGLKIIVDGPYLNLAPYLDGLFLGAGGGGLAATGDVDIKSSFDRVDLRERYSLNNVDLSLLFSGPQLTSLEIDGETDENANLNAVIGVSEETPGSDLSARVEDAGGLLRGVFGFDFVEGGTLVADGRLEGEGNPSKIDIRISDSRIRNAPFVTQILSIASLRGLGDVLTGDGIFLSKIEVPLSIDQRGYYIDGAKASGPAMGFTANGHILDDGDEINLSGVLVPSFGVNSALGSIPIIGDLFVSRDGEGVFAIRYGVKGSAQEANVSVNPLSGLLPGVLRRIFENPTDVPPPPDEGESPEALPN